MIELFPMRFLNDQTYLRYKYWLFLGKKLNLENPQTYNEKLQWLKINYRNPLCTKLVDKYEVREYVKNKIGEDHLIPLIGVWDDISEIDLAKLPNKFVLKCTHDSGSIVICNNKDVFSLDRDCKLLKKRLKTNYFIYSREWPYKNVKPRIIAEELMVDESGYELKDYKFFCFNGIPKYLYVASDRSLGTTKFDFFDMGFNHLPIENVHPNSNRIIRCPASFEKMKRIAASLSEGFPQVRVDLYDINGQLYFGEMTFFHHGGFAPFIPEKWDYEFGANIILPKLEDYYES